jgi:hypothetical protein
MVEYYIVIICSLLIGHTLAYQVFSSTPSSEESDESKVRNIDYHPIDIKT